MPRVDDTFKQKIFELVALIPPGRVMTYGQLAALAGAAWAAWEVGQLAHFGPDNLPWQRVVNKQGGLASGFVPGGRQGQKLLLEAEGIMVNEDFKINVEQLLWAPTQT